MGKDGQVRRLPNGHYGLWEWYPSVRRDADEPVKRKKPPENAEASGKDADASKDPADTSEGDK